MASTDERTQPHQETTAAPERKVRTIISIHTANEAVSPHLNKSKRDVDAYFSIPGETGVIDPKNKIVVAAVFDGVSSSSVTPESIRTATSAARQATESFQRGDPFQPLEDDPDTDIPTEERDRIARNQILRTLRVVDRSLKENGGASTAAVVEVYPDPEGNLRLTYGNIGDGRILLITSSGGRRLSIDDEAGDNQITRWVGERNTVSLEDRLSTGNQVVQASDHLHSMALPEDALYIVLMSDGVYKTGKGETIPSAYIRSILMDARRKKIDPAQHLLATVKRMGGGVLRDDATAVVIGLEKQEVSNGLEQTVLRLKGVASDLFSSTMDNENFESRLLGISHPYSYAEIVSQAIHSVTGIAVPEGTNLDKNQMLQYVLTEYVDRISNHQELARALDANLERRYPGYKEKEHQLKEEVARLQLEMFADDIDIRTTVAKLRAVKNDLSPIAGLTDRVTALASSNPLRREEYQNNTWSYLRQGLLEILQDEGRMKRISQGINEFPLYVNLAQALGIEDELPQSVKEASAEVTPVPPLQMKEVARKWAGIRDLA